MALVIGYGALWALLPTAQRYQSDFTLPYANAALLGSNHSMIYSPRAEAREAAARGSRPRVVISSDWLPTAIATMVPFTGLALVPAMTLWGSLQLALVVLAIWVATRTALRDWTHADRLAVGCAALAGIGTFQLLREGQWDGLPALGIAMAYAAWHRERGAIAAAVLIVTMLWAKPQLGIGIAVFLLGRLVPEELLAATVGAVAVIGLDLLILGSRLGPFLQAISTSAQVWPYSPMIGAVGLTSNVASDRTLDLILAVPLITAALICCLYLARWSLGRPRGAQTALPIVITLSLFAAPHGYVQDLVLAAPAFIFLLPHAAGVSPRVLWATFGAWALLNLTALAQTNGGRASALGPELVPIGLLILGGIGWLAVRHQPTVYGSSPARAGSRVRIERPGS